ncbi:hypothetical protein H0H92_002770 [Tricholoma furcatifolium]|nr:hypothetical protein H0H92_002770 [Tricholoma furcatifolium]
MLVFCSLILAIFVSVLPVLSSPLVQVQKFNGTTTGKYIVQLKPGVLASTFLAATNITATHQWTLINGFAGYLSAAQLAALSANPDVQVISEDGLMYAVQGVDTEEHDATWGLARLSRVGDLAGSDPNALNYNFLYHDNPGIYVNIYIIDTGVYHLSVSVNTEHEDFGGRASWGITYGGYASVDNNGHGTHCAGIAAGTQFGVAKSSNIIAVKVLADDGYGAVADIVSGMDYVSQQANITKMATVASISISGPVVQALDDAVAAVAAGNDGHDASNNSPARAPSAITVGATDITDTMAGFSNYGAVVDIFAPGVNIISTWIGNNTATHVDSGTSMATPQVAGLVAYYISLMNDSLPPDQMTQLILDESLPNVLYGIPNGTVNKLAHNGESLD